MLFARVDIVRELQRAKLKQKDVQEALLKEASGILEQSAREEMQIIQRLGSTIDYKAKPVNVADQLNVFSDTEIKAICLKYRLRFLNSGHFKGHIPYEAIKRIREFERENDLNDSEFRIMAPAELLNLEDSMKDPLLFICLADRKYLLIYKWGKDLSWNRALLNYPMRNIAALVLTAIFVALVATIFISSDYLIVSQTTQPLLVLHKTFIFFISSAFVFTMSLVYGIVTNKQFSEDAWNSKYFN